MLHIRGSLTLVLLVVLVASCIPLNKTITPLPTETSQRSLPIIQQATAAAASTATQKAPALSYAFLPAIQQAAPTPIPPPPGKDPIEGGHTFPPYSTSYYMTSVDTSVSFNMGCNIGLKDLNTPGAQDSLVVLDWGYPKYVNGYYGVSLMGYGPVSVDQVAEASKMFAWGYYNCTGADYDSHLRLALGTSNYKGKYDPSVTVEHGAAWANMVNVVAAWVVEKGIASQIDIVGANDIELSWSSYVDTKNWLDGYDSVNQYDMYNFGALPGCPTFSRPGSQCGTYPYLWSREQVWYVIYGAGPVYPLPEIYATNGVNAEQWYLMSVYSAVTHGYPVAFVGTMTNYQACQQRGCTGSEAGIDNTPQQGWTQLYKLLNGDKRTAQGLRWATDIRWTSPSSAALAAMQEGGGQVAPGDNLPPQEASAAVTAFLESGLQVSNLSDTLRLGLEEKLAAAQLAESQRLAGIQNRAGKEMDVNLVQATSEPPRPLELGEVLIEGSEGLVQPAEASIVNLWRGSLNNRSLQVLAGSDPNNPDQGLLIVLDADPNTADVQKTSYQSPTAAGPLTIIERQGDELLLSATNGNTANGVTLYFNLLTRQFR